MPPTRANCCRLLGTGASGGGSGASRAEVATSKKELVERFLTEQQPIAEKVRPLCASGFLDVHNVL